MSENVDISHLSLNEQKCILEVLKRDEDLKNDFQQKIIKLKTELQCLKKRSALKPSSNSTSTIVIDPLRNCSRCRAELGRIINRGAICHLCQLKVCKSCRIYIDGSGSVWMCIICHKHREIEAASGEWMNHFGRTRSADRTLSTSADDRPNAVHDLQIRRNRRERACSSAPIPESFDPRKRNSSNIRHTSPRRAGLPTVLPDQSIIERIPSPSTSRSASPSRDYLTSSKRAPSLSPLTITPTSKVRSRDTSPLSSSRSPPMLQTATITTATRSPSSAPRSPASRSRSHSSEGQPCLSPLAKKPPVAVEASSNNAFTQHKNDKRIKSGAKVFLFPSSKDQRLLMELIEGKTQKSLAVPKYHDDSDSGSSSNATSPSSSNLRLNDYASGVTPISPRTPTSPRTPLSPGRLHYETDEYAQSRSASNYSMHSSYELSCDGTKSPIPPPRRRASPLRKQKAITELPPPLLHYPRSDSSGKESIKPPERTIRKLSNVSDSGFGGESTGTCSAPLSPRSGVQSRQSSRGSSGANHSKTPTPRTSVQSMGTMDSMSSLSECETEKSSTGVVFRKVTLKKRKPPEPPMSPTDEEYDSTIDMVPATMSSIGGAQSLSRLDTNSYPANSRINSLPSSVSMSTLPSSSSTWSDKPPSTNPLTQSPRKKRKPVLTRYFEAFTNSVLGNSSSLPSILPHHGSYNLLNKNAPPIKGFEEPVKMIYNRPYTPKTGGEDDREFLSMGATDAKDSAKKKFSVGFKRKGPAPKPPFWKVSQSAVEVQRSDLKVKSKSKLLISRFKREPTPVPNSCIVDERGTKVAEHPIAENYMEEDVRSVISIETPTFSEVSFNIDTLSLDAQSEFNLNLGKIVPDSDDYRLVFISSSNSSKSSGLDQTTDSLDSGSESAMKANTVPIHPRISTTLRQRDVGDGSIFWEDSDWEFHSDCDSVELTPTQIDPSWDNVFLADCKLSLRQQLRKKSMSLEMLPSCVTLDDFSPTRSLEEMDCSNHTIKPSDLENCQLPNCANNIPVNKPKNQVINTYIFGLHGGAGPPSDCQLSADKLSTDTTAREADTVFDDDCKVNCDIESEISQTGLLPVSVNFEGQRGVEVGENVPTHECIIEVDDDRERQENGWRLNSKINRTDDNCQNEIRFLEPSTNFDVNRSVLQREVDDRLQDTTSTDCHSENFDCDLVRTGIELVTPSSTDSAECGNGRMEGAEEVTQLAAEDEVRPSSCKQTIITSTEFNNLNADPGHNGDFNTPLPLNSLSLNNMDSDMNIHVDQSKRQQDKDIDLKSSSIPDHVWDESSSILKDYFTYTLEGESAPLNRKSNKQPAAKHTTSKERVDLSPHPGNSIKEDNFGVPDTSFSSQSGSSSSEEEATCDLIFPLDYYLHTIIEESCEESEKSRPSSPIRDPDPSDLEKYFNFAISSNQVLLNDQKQRPLSFVSDISDTVSETSTSSSFRDDFSDSESADFASSRLEKYFMSGLIGTLNGADYPEDAEYAMTDESGDVTSDGEDCFSNFGSRRNSSVLSVTDEFCFLNVNTFSSSDSDNTVNSETPFECSDGFDTVKRKKTNWKSQNNTLSPVSGKTVSKNAADLTPHPKIIERSEVVEVNSDVLATVIDILDNICRNEDIGHVLNDIIEKVVQDTDNKIDTTCNSNILDTDSVYVSQLLDDVIDMVCSSVEADQQVDIISSYCDDLVDDIFSKAYVDIIQCKMEVVNDFAFALTEEIVADSLAYVSNVTDFSNTLSTDIVRSACKEVSVVSSIDSFVNKFIDTVIKDSLNIYAEIESREQIRMVEDSDCLLEEVTVVVEDMLDKVCKEEESTRKASTTSEDDALYILNKVMSHISGMSVKPVQSHGNSSGSQFNFLESQIKQLMETVSPLTSAAGSTTSEDVQSCTSSTVETSSISSDYGSDTDTLESSDVDDIVTPENCTTPTNIEPCLDADKNASDAFDVYKQVMASLAKINSGNDGATRQPSNAGDYIKNQIKILMMSVSSSNSNSPASTPEMKRNNNPSSSHCSELDSELVPGMRVKRGPRSIDSRSSVDARTETCSETCSLVSTSSISFEVEDSEGTTESDDPKPSECDVILSIIDEMAKEGKDVLAGDNDSAHYGDTLATIFGNMPKLQMASSLNPATSAAPNNPTIYVRKNDRKESFENALRVKTDLEVHNSVESLSDIPEESENSQSEDEGDDTSKRLSVIWVEESAVKVRDPIRDSTTSLCSKDSRNTRDSSASLSSSKESFVTVISPLDHPPTRRYLSKSDSHSYPALPVTRKYAYDHEIHKYYPIKSHSTFQIDSEGSLKPRRRARKTGAVKQALADLITPHQHRRHSTQMWVESVQLRQNEIISEDPESMAKMLSAKEKASSENNLLVAISSDTSSPVVATKSTGHIPDLDQTKRAFRDTGYYSLKSSGESIPSIGVSSSSASSMSDHISSPTRASSQDVSMTISMHNISEVTKNMTHTLPSPRSSLSYAESFSSPNIPADFLNSSTSKSTTLPTKSRLSKYGPPNTRFSHRAFLSAAGIVGRLKSSLFRSHDVGRVSSPHGSKIALSTVVNQEASSEGLLPQISVSDYTQKPHKPTGNDDDVEQAFTVFRHRSRTSLSSFGARSESMTSVYSAAGGGRYGTVTVTGDILFKLSYNYKAGTMEIHVQECRDLAPVDARRSRSDPYVKAYLLPDKTKGGKRKTKVKKHTLNPIFDEMLKFHVTISELETRTLWMTVWHSDMFGRNDFLGEIMLPLGYEIFDKQEAKWHPLQERIESLESPITYKGDINVALKFVPPDVTSHKKSRYDGSKGELHLLVKEARNLMATRANGTSDPFCKSYLLPEKSKTFKQKTPVIKKNCNPNWNHTFVYEKISVEELHERCLELTIWDYDKITSNDFLGGVRLSLGTGKYHAREVDWMDSKNDEVRLWQEMLEKPNQWISGSLILRPNMQKQP